MLDVVASDTILKVQARLQGDASIPQEQQLLMYSGKQLENGHTLSDYNIKGESKLLLRKRC